MKIVINACFGGFNLSQPALELLRTRAPELVGYFESGEIYLECDNGILTRTNTALVSVIEELGDSANGPCAKLKVLEIPDGVPVHIEEYDGFESVREDHRVWE